MGLSDKRLIHFNSHAHVERDGVYLTEYLKETISTHTLTWSVTGSGGSYHGQAWYFNSHAHVERDADVQEARHGKWDFNSHAHVERDGKIHQTLCGI